MSIYDIITGGGGTDSRTILAHLEYLKVNCELIISGSENFVDVKIARKIAEK